MRVHVHTASVLEKSVSTFPDGNEVWCHTHQTFKWVLRIRSSVLRTAWQPLPTKPAPEPGAHILISIPGDSHIQRRLGTNSEVKVLANRKTRVWNPQNPGKCWVDMFAVTALESRDGIP